MSGCVLCGLLTGEARASEHWRVVANRNQNLLGKTMLVLRRHLVGVADLSAGEWADLHVQLADVTRKLDAAFAPDHYNYVFLQNADRHVHLHVIPRYAEPREFKEERFEDPDWPDHYLPGRERRVPPSVIDSLVAKLR
jgi:diadenosine tetraphosphate (Ap4A) HIT family hydrolase